MPVMSKRKKWGFGFLCLLVLGLGVLNVLAYNHASSMLNYASGGGRTVPPEDLSFWGKMRVLIVGVNLERPETDRTPRDWGLDYESRRIDCDNGIRLGAWYIPAAESEVLVVLLHGYGAEKSSLMDDAKALHAAGYACLLVDFRGSGESSESVTTIGYIEGEDVSETMSYVETEWPDTKVVLYGYSMGAVALLNAIDRFGVEPDGVVIGAVYDSMLTTVRNRFHVMGVPSFPSAECLIFWAGWQFDFNAFENNPADYATRVSCPALVMHGSADTRAQLEEGRRVYDALPGSAPKTFVEFKGLGHETYPTGAPELWSESVLGFMRTIGKEKAE